MWKQIAILLVTSAPWPALASASLWQEIAPETRVRLVSADTLVDGRALAGLEIEMPADTKTYWRIPGETGFPAEFDFSGSSGAAAATVLWPHPEIDRSQGYLDYVYHGHVVLPIEFDAGTSGAVLDLAFTLGICSDVCVPATAKLTLPMSFSRPDAAQSIRLEQALAETPILWDQPRPPFSVVTAGLDGSLHLENPDPSIDPASLIADVGDPSILFETPQKSPDGALWTLAPLGAKGGKGLEGRTVQLTFETADGPYLVSRVVAPSQP